MGKIGDLWVRLGLKSDDYKKGMKDAKKETSNFSQNLGKMKATAIAVWAAVGTAVVKFAKDLIVSTNRMGDAWATFTSQSKAAWDTFLSSVSSWDFSNFFARMREATAEAAEFAKAMDSEFEVGNSIKLQRAAMAAELAALKVQMQDATKTFDERIAAAQNYIDKVTPIYAQIEAQAKRMEDASFGPMANTAKTVTILESPSFTPGTGTSAGIWASTIKIVRAMAVSRAICVSFLVFTMHRPFRSLTRYHNSFPPKSKPRQIFHLPEYFLSAFAHQHGCQLCFAEPLFKTDAFD